jgi:hypothetical protein
MNSGVYLDQRYYRNTRSNGSLRPISNDIRITAKMANLVPYDAKNIVAKYSSATKQFSVAATALLPITFLGAEFKRQDEFLGGREFRLEGFTGGLSPPKQVMMQKPYIENDMTVPPKFSAIFVVLLDPVKKTETTVSVNLTLDAPVPAPVHTIVAPVPFRPQPMPAAISTKNGPPALKVIEIGLPAQNLVRITAPMPDTASPRPTIERRNEGNFTFTWRTRGETQGSLIGTSRGLGTAQASTRTLCSLSRQQLRRRLGPATSQARGAMRARK